jgi:outer membrane protein assembly factor BamB
LLRLVLCSWCCSCAQHVTSDAPLSKASPWPKFRRDLAQTGQSPAKAQPGAKGFSFQTGKGIFSSAVIDGDGTLYLGSADRTFYAIGADGALKWKLLTGEIIDSSALLDDTGGVYFGSGDGKLRGLDAKTGAERWVFEADAPSVNKAVINWFEGNVAIGPDGRLWAGNDNFFLYGVDRATGKLGRRLRMPDQTWSLPAFDAATGALFVGNNNLVDLYGDNTFSFAADGSKRWSLLTKGTMAASPLLTQGLAIVGGFDGILRAHDQATGEVKWTLATRDHLYASPALLPDGRVVQASTDGTVYCVNAATGAVEWTYEVSEPVRSSPAVDAEGHVIFGGGDGRLYVLNSNGTLRWAMQLITDERNDLNSSPALGNDSIVIGGENGVIFSVPYEACPSKTEPRCVTPPAPDVTARGELRFVSGFGAVTASAPPTLGSTEPLTLELFVFDGARRSLATMENASLKVTVTPPVAVKTRAFGGGRYLVVEPVEAWPAQFSVQVKGNWLVDLVQDGLKLSGGRPGGAFDTSFSFSVPEGSGRTFDVPGAPGRPQTVWEISRLALPTPTLLPSYNQIGFDSLHYVLTPIEGTADDALAVMIGARLKEGVNETEVDPATKGVIPLRLRRFGDGITARIDTALGLEVMNLTLKFESFRVSATLPETAEGLFTSRLTGSTLCSQVPIYGAYLKQVGLCSDATDEFSVSGATNMQVWTAPAFPELAVARATPPGLTRVSEVFEVDLSAWHLVAGKHHVTLVPVDAVTGRAMPVDLGLALVQRVATDGSLAAISLTVPGSMGKALRLHVLIDAQLASTLVSSP